MNPTLLVFVFVAVFVLYVIAKTAVVVPQQNAYVVERLGRFSGVLDAGFHILFPFVDVIRYRHVLKEQAIDIPEQVCITKDNVQVGGGRHPLPEGHGPRARLATASRTTSSRSPSSRRPPSAARSARSTWTAPSRSASTSTVRW